MSRARLARLSAAALMSAFVTVTNVATAETVFPSKPITMLVAFPPGGPADVLARALQPTMSKLLGQPLIVENVPGAGGVLAVHRMLSRPADGYTLILGSPNEAILAPLSNLAAKYEPEALTLLAPISMHPLVVMARDDLPFDTLEQVIAAGTSSGGKGLTFGSPGYGSMYHIIAEYIAQTTNTQLLHIPYKGASPMMQDLVGKQIDLTILPNIGNSTQLLATHKIKALSVLDTQRMQTLQDVQAISESSIAQKNELIHSVWTAVMVKAGVPPDRMAILLNASQQAIRSPEMIQTLALSGAEPMAPQVLDASAKFYTSEIGKFKDMADSINLTAQ